MPIYDYQCEDCGFVSEDIITDVEDTYTVVCRGCGGTKCRRLMPSVGLVCPTKPGCFSGPHKEKGRKMR